MTRPATRAEALARQPHAGQTWTPTRPGSRAKPRTVLWAGEMPKTMPRWLLEGRSTVGFVADPAQPAQTETGHDSYVGVEAFRAWIRKHDAVPSQPEGAPYGGGAGVSDVTARPEVRLNEDGTLDEVVANGAHFHLEQMDHGEWWMCIESGGVRVDITLHTPRGGRILANVDQCAITPPQIRPKEAPWCPLAPRMGCDSGWGAGRAQGAKFGGGR